MPILNTLEPILVTYSLRAPPFFETKSSTRLPPPPLRLLHDLLAVESYEKRVLRKKKRIALLRLTEHYRINSLSSRFIRFV